MEYYEDAQPDTDSELPHARPVSGIMGQPVYAVSVHGSLAEAFRLMGTHHVSGLPVTDGDQFVGVVTLSDCAKYAAGGDARKSVDLSRVQVAEVMSKEIITVGPKVMLGHVAWRMSNEHIHRVFVEENGTLIGVVTGLDVAKALGRQFRPGSMAEKID